MKQWAIGLMSNEEKRNILDKHKYLYDGYRTMQPEVAKEQPLFVQDFANDKKGLTVNNKFDVKTYTNVGINESKDDKGMCSECGGMMYEGECSECGWKGDMGEETQQVKDLDNVEDLNLSDKFDYVEGEVDETEQGNPYDKMDEPYDFEPKGPKKSGDAFTVKVDDMDLDDEEVRPSFDFESEGPMKVYETMESAFSNDGVEETSEQYPPKHVWNKMKRKNRADAEGEEFDDSELDMSDYEEFEPNNSSWEEINAMVGDDEFSNLDEDIKESVVLQKNRIVEMMERMKKF